MCSLQFAWNGAFVNRSLSLETEHTCNIIFISTKYSRSHAQSKQSEFDSQTQHHMWVEFVAGSLLCSKRFFSGYSGFPLSLKTTISKFQFDPGMHRHFWTSSCELLSAPWVNKITFTFTSGHVVHTSQICRVGNMTLQWIMNIQLRKESKACVSAIRPLYGWQLNPLKTWRH